VKATEVTAGLAESYGSLLPGLWSDSLHVTCGLTACTPGSAPGPTLGNEYGKTVSVHTLTTWHCLHLPNCMLLQQQPIDISCQLGPQQQAISSGCAAVTSY